MQPPAISIYIPTYNRLSLLKRAVNSLLVQTFQDFEILLVDDGSTDGTKDYLINLQKSYKNIRVLKKEGSRGAPTSRNLAINAASGRYITGLDDDDFVTPSHLQDLLYFYDQKYSFVFARKRYWRDIFFSPLCFVNRTVSYKQLLFFNIVGNQIFTETSKIRVVGGFDPELGAAQDYDLWLRLLERFGPAKFAYNETYQTDTDHGFDRITNNKIEKIRSYEHILLKNSSKIDVWVRHSFALRCYLLGQRVGHLGLLMACMDLRNLRHLLSAIKIKITKLRRWSVGI